MTPFKLPAIKTAQVRRKVSRQNSTVSRAVSNMESVMKDAVDYIFNHYQKTGQYAEPTLNSMYEVSENFYRDVLHQAIISSREEKNNPTKRLARLPLGLPRTLKEFEKVFRDKKYWPKILKRSNILTERLRKAYLQKLRRKFQAVIPKLVQGIITVEEAKKDMMQAWSASKSRVTLIFRTETTTYFGKTQVAFFKGDDQVIGFLFDAIKDTVTTKICKSRHGLVYRPDTQLLKENTPACHYNCRSHLIALADTPMNRKMLNDPSRDPTKKRVEPLPKGWRK